MSSDNIDNGNDTVSTSFDLLGELNKGGNTGSTQDSGADNSNNNNNNNQDVLNQSAITSDLLSSIFGPAGSLLDDVPSNDGTGDTVQDLINWVTNIDRLPSDPLASFLGNYALKSELAIYFIVMENMRRVKNLAEFIKVSEEVLYNPLDVYNISPGDLETRHNDAVKSLELIIEHTRKAVFSLKQQKRKDKTEDETDKLKMLLSALPANKIRELMKSLR